MTMGFSRRPSALDIAKGLRKRSAQAIVWELADALRYYGLPRPSLKELSEALELGEANICRHWSKWDRDKDKPRTDALKSTYWRLVRAETGGTGSRAR